MSTARAWGRALRPAHWLKNVPVGAALLFGHRLGDPDAVRATAIAFVAFCALASAGYLLNDVVDRAADRLHPARRLRPVAAGEIAPASALAAAVGLAAGALLAAACLLPSPAPAVLAGYGLATASYTLVCRRVPGLGPVVVAAGFVLRVLGGACAARVDPSPWLLALTAVLALALAVAKREAEARRADGEAPTRLRRATDALLVGSAAGYVAWTLWPATVALHGTRWLVVTAAPVLLALALFRRRLRRDREGRGPADLVARDPVLLWLGVLWAVLCAMVVRAGP